jgi:NADH-quinone oxidoreductase subunit M
MRFFFNPDFDILKIFITEINLKALQQQIWHQEEEFIYLSYFEQNANNLKFNLNEYMFSMWSYLSMADFFLILFLYLLWTPLFFSILILIIHLWSLYKNLYFGHEFKIETNSVNFFSWTFQWWFLLYWTSYTTIDRHIYTFGLNYPNPRSVQHFFFQIFLWKEKPILLWIIFFFLLLILVLNYPILIGDNMWIISIFVAYIIIYKWNYMTEQVGLKLKWFMCHFHKGGVGFRLQFGERLYLRLYLSTYPVLLSFIHFIVTTILVFSIYLDFFFNPLIIWNGYFIKTIVSFFFYGIENNENSLFSNIFFNLDYFVGLDGLNVWLFWLTSLLVFLCSLFLFENYKNDNFFFQMGWIFLLQFAALQFFCVTSYFWMYIFFELSLLPIYVLIVYCGSNRWKIHAAYQMVLFTFVGSLFLLAGILILFLKLKTFNTLDIFFTTWLDYDNIIFSSFEKKLIWLLLFIGFAVKTPLYPFHIWLPEAHSEAPTTGSVLLAGVLLKMGTYGFLWFVIPLFPEILDFFKTLVFSMCICGIILSSLAALSQIDIKKIIAYSSIGHMGLVIMGIYNMNMFGLLGASFMMISHGLVSAALFFCVGLLYKIYGTRSLVYYSSIAHFMPKFSLCFFIFSLANMGFPGTVGFPSEILIFSSLVGDNFFLTLLVGFGSIIGGVYSIWLLTWLLYGQISPKITFYWDIKPLEWKILIYLTFLIIFFGFFPFIMLDFFKPFCSFFLN